MNETSKNQPEEPANQLQVKSVIERSKNQPDTCRIYTASESDAVDETEWIAAREGSFVFVDLMR